MNFPWLGECKESEIPPIWKIRRLMLRSGGSRCRLFHVHWRGLEQNLNRTKGILKMQPYFTRLRFASHVLKPRVGKMVAAAAREGGKEGKEKHREPGRIYDPVPLFSLLAVTGPQSGIGGLEPRSPEIRVMEIPRFPDTKTDFSISPPMN